MAAEPTFAKLRKAGPAGREHDPPIRVARAAIGSSRCTTACITADLLVRISAMSALLEQSRSQVINSAAELALRAGGQSLEPFLSRYYRHMATEDLLARGAEDLLGAAVSHQELAVSRPVGTANVRVFTPTVEEHGWSCGHTVIEIVTDD